MRTFGLAAALVGTVTGSGCSTGGARWDRADSHHASRSASWHRWMEEEYGEDTVPPRRDVRREAHIPTVEDPHARGLKTFFEILGAVLLAVVTIAAGIIGALQRSQG